MCVRCGGLGSSPFPCPRAHVRCDALPLNGMGGCAGLVLHGLHAAADHDAHGTGRRGGRLGHPAFGGQLPDLRGVLAAGAEPDLCTGSAAVADFDGGLAAFTGVRLCRSHICITSCAHRWCQVDVASTFTHATRTHAVTHTGGTHGHAHAPGPRTRHHGHRAGQQRGHAARGRTGLRSGGREENRTG